MHELVIIVAKYFIVLSVLGAVAVWLKLPRPDKKQFIVVALLGAVLSLVLAKIGSKLFYDPRPFVAGHFAPYFTHANDNGFPSDHTLFASFLAFVSWKYNRAAGAALLAVAILVGLSRCIAGVHHLADILGSIVFAAAGVCLAALIVRRLGKGKRRPPAHAAPRQG